MKNLVTMLALIVLAAPVYANGGGEGDNTDCQGQGNPNSPCDGGGGGGGEGGGGNGGNGGSSTNDNTNTNTNDNTNQQGQAQGQIQGQIATGGDATATGGSVGDTTATGGDGGNATINIGTGGYGEGEGQGEGSGVLSSNVGDTTATTGDQTTDVDNTNIQGQVTDVNVDNTDNSFDGGNTLIIGGGGQGECYEGECSGGSGTLNSNANSESNSESNNENDNSNSNDVNNDIDIDASSTYQAAAIPVNSAPPSFSAICSSGGAGSGKSFSLSLAVTNDVCQALMVADAYAAMGDMESALKWVEAAARHAKWKGGMGYFRHVITLGIM